MRKYFGSAILIIVLGFVLSNCIAVPGSKTASVATNAVSTREENGAETMGPYDVAELPLVIVPAPDPEEVFNPRRGGGDPGFGGEPYVQILRVLKDPREVPLERSLYYGQPGKDVIVHPDAERISERFAGQSQAAVAVYVRVTGFDVPENYAMNDPFYVTDPEQEGGFAEAWSPWSELKVADPEGGISLPCAPQTFGGSSKPYVIPDTGEEFDPDTYAPPKPWYDAKSRRIEVDEVREGWLICLAPDIPVEQVRIEWHGVGLTGIESQVTETLWARLQPMPMGEWYLMEEAEVVGWNDINEAKPGGGEPGSAAHYDDPPTSAQTVYEGPVWISMSTGMVYGEEVREYNHRIHREVWAENRWPRGEINTSLNTIYRFECDGVAAINEYEERGAAVCLPKTKVEVYARVTLQMYFEGMEEQLEQWDNLSLNVPLSARFYLQGDLKKMVAYVTDVHLRAEQTWIKVLGLPDEEWALWGAVATGTDREWAGNWPGRVPVWKVDLYDGRAETVSTEVICQVMDCMHSTLEAEIISEYGTPTLRKLDFDAGSVPIFPAGTFANGIRVKRSWFVDGEILWNDNFDDLADFTPVDWMLINKKWLFIEVESTPGVITYGSEITLIYFRSDGQLIASPLEAGVYYEGTTGLDAHRSTFISELRGATESLVFKGVVPREWSIDRIIMVEEISGPAWRLR